MKILPIIVLLTLAAGFGELSSRASRRGGPTSVDEILNRYERAVGGKEAFAKLTTRICRGTNTWVNKGTSSPIETYARAPNKFAIYWMGPGSTAARAFDGKVGWSRNYSEEGLRVLAGAELLADQRDADFYQQIRLREL